MAVSTTPYADSIFEQPWWLDIVAEGKWEEIIIKEKGEVVARFPYYITRKSIILPPFTQTMGIWMKPNVLEFQKGNTQLSRQKEIIAEIVDKLPANRGIDIRLDSNNSYVLPFRWHRFRIEPTFSYRIDNLQNIENIYQNLHKNVIRDIKSADKKVDIEISEDVDSAIYLLDKTYEKQNRVNPQSKKLEEKIISYCIKNETGKLLMAYEKGTHIPCSFSFLVYDEKRCYNLMSGTDPRYSKYSAQNLLLWRGIEYAVGVSQCFDFEGSMIEGIENLFRKYGGERVINYRIYRLPIWREFWDVMRPRVKRFIGYKI